MDHEAESPRERDGEYVAPRAEDVDTKLSPAEVAAGANAGNSRLAP